MINNGLISYFSYISSHGYGYQQEGHSGMNGTKKEAAGDAKLILPGVEQFYIIIA
jgi:hypothetical protein